MLIMWLQTDFRKIWKLDIQKQELNNRDFILYPVFQNFINLKSNMFI